MWSFPASAPGGGNNRSLASRPAAGLIRTCAGWVSTGRALNHQAVRPCVLRALFGPVRVLADFHEAVLLFLLLVLEVHP